MPSPPSTSAGIEEPTIELYMQSAPVTIDPEQPLAAAHALMRAHSIRHLPVVAGQTLVGLVSVHDLHLLETLDGVDENRVSVREAMSHEPYAVGPGAVLRQVALEMADRKISSAVVVDGERVIGILTAVDALRGLSLLTHQLLSAMR
jgi:CBS domain-containing protein